MQVAPRNSTLPKFKSKFESSNKIYFSTPCHSMASGDNDTMTPSMTGRMTTRQVTFVNIPQFHRVGAVDKISSLEVDGRESINMENRTTSRK